MVVGTKLEVMHGHADVTPGGLKAGDLMRTSDGRIVSKKQHEAGKDSDHLKKWRAAVEKARKKLKIDKADTVPLPPKLVTAARKIYKKK